jgi:hypothetical protein
MKISHSALILHTLKSASPERLQKAINGIADNSLTIILTRQSDAEIRALVTNGDGILYGVTLTESLTACSCKDALYRGGICKHGVAVALHILRIPQPKKEVPTPQFPTFHLMWRDGIVLCGDPYADRVQMYPWTANMISWPETCSACVTAYHHPNPAPSIALPPPDLSLAKT